MTNLQLAIQFFLQLGIILIICRVVGIIAARFGQPQVVAEMIAGVCMGPSLLGALAPAWSDALFPKDSMKVLFPVSQLGLALYMFIVGLEFRIDIVRKRFGSSVAVSLAGMAAPFVLGAALGWFLWNNTALFPKATSMHNAMIFMGASMCITAFPMLARIIHFKGLAGTTMGTVAIGAGAIDDAAAWGMLAAVLASFNGDMSHAFLSIGGGIAYVAIAHLIIRPILARYAAAIEARGKLSDGEYAFFLALMCFGSWWTDYIELHAVFGAFVIAGIVGGGGVPVAVAAEEFVGVQLAEAGEGIVHGAGHEVGEGFVDGLKVLEAAWAGEGVEEAGAGWGTGDGAGVGVKKGASGGIDSKDAGIAAQRRSLDSNP